MVSKLILPPSLSDPQDLHAVIAYDMRLHRVSHGWSQEELACQCGLDRTRVSAVKRKRWNIAFSDIEKITPTFKIAPYKLLLPPQEMLRQVTEPADTQA